MSDQTCGSCGAPVWWLTNTKTGKRAPIDVYPVLMGNIAVDLGRGTYRVLKAPERKEQRGMGRLLCTSHFATCTHAAEHRRR